MKNSFFDGQSVYQMRDQPRLVVRSTKISMNEPMTRISWRRGFRRVWLVLWVAWAFFAFFYPAYRESKWWNNLADLNESVALRGPGGPVQDKLLASTLEHRRHTVAFEVHAQVVEPSFWLVYAGALTVPPLFLYLSARLIFAFAKWLKAGFVGSDSEPPA